MGTISNQLHFDVYPHNHKLEPHKIYINNHEAKATAKISFSFNDSNLEDELGHVIGDTPSNIRISTRLYEFDTQAGDIIIAHSAEHSSPLIVLRDSSIILNFDLSMARQVYYADSKRPIYTFIPFFNIRTIPPAIRRPISNLIASKKCTFDNLEEALAYYRILPLNTNDFIRLLLNGIVCRHLKFDRSIYEWPDNKKAVFISLHDVDSDGLLKRKKSDPILSIDNKHGIKANWFLLTTALGHGGKEQLAFLKEDGHEVGWHGYNHDHRLPFGRNTRKRIKHLNRSILVDDQNYPLGMRAPKLLKTRHLYSSLERYCPAMCYDTSFLQGIAPHYLPGEAGKHRIVEIPTTVPADIRLYCELANLPEAERYEATLKIQMERTERLIEAGALISIVTHPEYDLSMKPELLKVYDRYLSYLRTRDDVWFTTAGSLYKYWTENEPHAIHERD